MYHHEVVKDDTMFMYIIGQPIPLKIVSINSIKTGLIYVAFKFLESHNSCVVLCNSRDCFPIYPSKTVPYSM